MSSQVIYRQLNKDYAYWIEKRRLGQPKGGHVAGLLTHLEAGVVKTNILFDAGLGTIEGIADSCEDAFWDEPLSIFITHGHIDHHAELMILSEIYCQRREANWRLVRPPLVVNATTATQTHLDRTHWWGYRGGETLAHQLLTPGQAISEGIFTITPLAVDHFEGAVIFTVEFELDQPQKIVIGWDLTTLPQAAAEMRQLQAPSLILLDGTTWAQPEVGHTTIENLAESGFLAGLQLEYHPARQKHGAYLVHYSGWEDDWGMLTDAALKAKFDDHYPTLAPVVRVAARGQSWEFS